MYRTLGAGDTFTAAALFGLSMCMQAQAQAQAQTQTEHQDETQRQASLDNMEVSSSPNGHGEENISRHLASSSDSTTGTNQPAYSSTGLPAGLDFAVALATQKVQREGFTGPMDSEAHGLVQMLLDRLGQASS
ncbi:hypothetical protein CFIMG_005251RA [Ceratocystis fimbriata CBS 114723]|uniref:Uncharacterized protein n=1 Tax=Ceratocystis fimbriata CBS 114723 TaxID=1035309 RepID=A0A2C5WVD9_9PEZI|nr:hypothetical protein CFIMG_005251RA [Ceratocystis fimbriata CBS 114723]